MSKIGGQNEVAAMSVGLTVDTAGLDASLAEARKKLDDFKQESERIPIKPTTPANLPVDKTEPGRLPFDPKDTPIFPGAGKGPGYDIAPEIEKTDQAVKKTTFSWKELSSEIRGASAAVFGFLSVAGTAVAGVIAVANAGKFMGDRFFEAKEKLQDLNNALVNFNRVYSLQSGTMEETINRRLASSGVRPELRAAIMSEYSGARTVQQKAQEDLSKAEGEEYGFGSAVFDYLIGPTGVLSEFGIAFDSPKDKRLSLAKRQSDYANEQLRSVSDRIDKLTNDVPVSGFINTDAGLGSSVRTMSISNVRMDQRDEQARKAEYSQRQVDANRRRSP